MKIKTAGALSADQHDTSESCVVHLLDVHESGLFQVPALDQTILKFPLQDETWAELVKSDGSDNNRLRCLFIDKILSDRVLQMLGARYNIKPVCFSSLLECTTLRYQEEFRHEYEDHVTVTLIFPRLFGDSGLDSNGMPLRTASPCHTSARSPTNENAGNVHPMIDTHLPLRLGSSGRLLSLNLLSVHLIRRQRGSTIISYCPDEDSPMRKIPFLHERISFAGRSVYWQNIFQGSNDPTFILLIFLWYALYAWDEALESLSSHIYTLESQAIASSEIGLAEELRVVCAHNLHYSALLKDFRESVIFVRDTKNPALEQLSRKQQEEYDRIMTRECSNLLVEIDRLDYGNEMQDRRLRNTLNLIIRSVSLTDNKRMQQKIEAAIRRSAALTQIGYLTLVSLFASSVAAVFGMNLEGIVPGTHSAISHYAGAAIPLTLILTWAMTTSHWKLLNISQEH